MELNVIITAAGNSGRMGFMKPFLKWDAHEDFLGKIVGEYLAFGCRPLVVLNEEGMRLVRSANPPWVGASVTITNQHPELERFHSVKLAAEYLTENSWCFIQSVDNPFISAGILKGLEELHPEGYSQPVCKGRNGHPVFVSPRVVGEIQKSEEEAANLRDVLACFEKVEYPTTDESVLVNINTPEDYLKHFGRPINLSP